MPSVLLTDSWASVGVETEAISGLDQTETCFSLLTVKLLWPEAGG